MSEVAPEVQHFAELSPGAILKNARLERGMTPADIAQRLKFGERQIDALEADEFGRLPGTTVVRGMVRGYCKLLEIDPAPVLKLLDHRLLPLPVTVESPKVGIPFPDGKRRSTRLFLGLSMLVALAVLAVSIEWRIGDGLFFAPAAVPTHVVVPPPNDSLRETDQPVASAEQPSVVTAAGAANHGDAQSAPVVGPDDGNKRILLEFQRESWVEIRDREGKKIISQMNAGGTQKLVEGTPPFEIVIGNAPNVRLRYNDETVDLRPYFKVDVARLTLE